MLDEILKWLSSLSPLIAVLTTLSPIFTIFTTGSAIYVAMDNRKKRKKVFAVSVNSVALELILNYKVLNQEVALFDLEKYSFRSFVNDRSWIEAKPLMGEVLDNKLFGTIDRAYISLRHIESNMQRLDDFKEENRELSQLLVETAKELIRDSINRLNKHVDDNLRTAINEFNKEFKK